MHALQTGTFTFLLSLSFLSHRCVLGIACGRGGNLSGIPLVPPPHFLASIPSILPQASLHYTVR